MRASLGCMSDADLPVTDSEEEDPISSMMVAAWGAVGPELEADGVRWGLELKTSVDGAAHLRVAHEAVSLMIRALLEASVRMQFALAQGAIGMPLVEKINLGLASFAHAVATGVRASCAGLECDWTGQAGDAGPVARCPKCGGRVAPLHKLGLVGANGRGIHA